MPIREASFSWNILNKVARRAPIDTATVVSQWSWNTDTDSNSPENTAPVSWILKLWLVEKTRGMELKFRYRIAQLKATQREKKNTTGSVNKRSAP